ncbi:MAG: EpsI family protein, partial [Desulfobulbus propionicus]
NGGSFQVVFYWFQNRGRIIGSEYWEKIYLIWDALTKGRRDGAFVRIISMVDGDGISAAEQRVAAFAEMVIPELEQFLPGEFL